MRYRSWQVLDRTFICNQKVCHTHFPKSDSKKATKCFTGVRSSRIWSTSQLISPSGQQLHHSSGVCPQIQGWQCGENVGAVEEMVCVVCVDVAEGHSGDGCDLALNLCKYDLRKGDLFVLSWARVRRGRRGSISSELLMCAQYFVIVSCG